MDGSRDGDTITIELTRNEAIVLDQWLCQLDKPSFSDDLPPLEQAALRARCDLECVFEKQIHEYFDPNGDEIIAAAIDDVRDDEYRPE